MSTKDKPKFFPLKKAEIESMLLIAEEYLAKTNDILRDHYTDINPIGEFSLMKVGMVQYYCQSLRAFIEKNFDPQLLEENEAFEAYPQEIQSMAKIILTVSTAKAELAGQNVFLENQ
jgi:hypothetical protein